GQLDVGGHPALEQCERDRAEVDVIDDGAEPADRTPRGEHGIAGGWAIGAAVQMQQDQHAGWFTEVVHPGHGLLAAIAALVEVHRTLAGTTDPTDLVGDGALVGVDAQPRSQRRDPVRLVRPYARRA